MDHEFCRSLLRETMKEARAKTTAEQRKAAWAYRYDWGDQVEFHGPDRFYWNGQGCCVWCAKAKGWAAWLEKDNDAV